MEKLRERSKTLLGQLQNKTQSFRDSNSSILLSDLSGSVRSEESGNMSALILNDLTDGNKTNNSNFSYNTNNNNASFLREDDEVAASIQVDTADNRVQHLSLDEDVTVIRSPCKDTHNVRRSLSYHSTLSPDRETDTGTEHSPISLSSPTRSLSHFSVAPDMDSTLTNRNMHQVGDSVEAQLSASSGKAGHSYVHRVSVVTPPRSASEQRSPPYYKSAAMAAIATPKSILKRRYAQQRAIDDNTRVESRFQHTPGWIDAARRAGSPRRATAARLNMSYSMDEQLPIHAQRSSASGNYMESSRREGERSSRGNRADKSSVMRKLVSFEDGSGARGRRAGQEVNDTDVGAMIESVNNRRKGREGGPVSSGRMDMARPAASVSLHDVFGGGSVSDEYRASNWVYGDLPPLDKSQSTAGDRRLLGYDWIAGLLESDNPALSKSEEYFNNVREFRRNYKDECSTSFRDVPGSPVTDTSMLPDVANYPSPEHTCIHNYVVNDRLFTVPTNPDTQGRSKCPVCQRKQKDPTVGSPGFVRVSVPRSTLVSPLKIRPHRRKSFDPSDSYALSRHCLAGWESQRPAGLPQAQSIDLSSETMKLKSKWTTTMGEAEKIAKKLKKGPIKMRDLETTTLYSRELRKVTDNLLSLSSALDYQSQIMQKATVL